MGNARHRNRSILVAPVFAAIFIFANPSTDLLRSALGAEVSYSIVQLQTAFIYQFTKYIEWPEADGTGNFVISVLGDSQILEPLKDLARQNNINGRKIDIQNPASIDELKKCHILFVATGNEATLRQIQGKLKKSSTLIIGPAGSAKHGAIIGFYTEDGKLRFEVNTKEAESRGIVISSQLLKLARIVE